MSDEPKSLLELAGGDGGKIEMFDLPDGRLELRLATPQPAHINRLCFDRFAVIAIRGAINAWLETTR